MRRYSIEETRITSLYMANPEAANPFGTIHGGRIMRWMIASANIAATRVASGPVLLSHIDDVFFINPVSVGEVLKVTSWIEYVGRTSMEVAVKTVSENPITGEERLTTLSHMVFVAVDEGERPREVPASITPSVGEERLYEEAERRRQQRLRMICDRRSRMLDVEPYARGVRRRTENLRMVFPDDAIYKGLMFAGRLLFLLDEQAGYLANSFARQVCVTASMDSMDFYCPIYVGDFLEITAALTYVGRSSAEVGVKVIKRSPLSGERLHVGSCFFTFVALKSRGEKGLMPPYTPETPEERRLWEEGEARRRARLERLRDFKLQVQRWK